MPWFLAENVGERREELPGKDGNITLQYNVFDGELTGRDRGPEYLDRRDAEEQLLGKLSPGDRRVT